MLRSVFFILMITEEDIEFMGQAMNLAKNGTGFVCPNPLVGAVIVHEGKCLAGGYHHKYGEKHAERDALSQLSNIPAGATMYVTLEPCCHYGKQPPCTEAILESGIKRVVVGMKDPNPLVAGKGIDFLRKNGIEVESGVLENELVYLNRAFLKHITTGMPWVTLKTAMTLDGKTATATGHSKWITGEESRKEVHRMRSLNQAILVGKKTVESDDCMLNNRLEPSAYQPIRIVTDSKASLSTDFSIFSSAKEQRTILAHTIDAPLEKIEQFNDMGVETICCASAEGQVDMTDLFRKLGEKKINSILVEGGSEVNYSIIHNELADEAFFFIAPKVIGGASAPGPIGGKGIDSMDMAEKLDIKDVVKIGEDIMIHGLFQKDK
jgi:diaminohydroxyphosphoribosylaminopyrimidine deaminase / 5-amino-6-(5-phosphoribosylamino)uracil reductase